MKRVNEHDLEFRHGTHGPKYLFRGPHQEWGIIVIPPGGDLGAHKHQQVEETFYFPDSAPKMIIAGEEHRVRPGDAFYVEATEPHDIVNDTGQDVRLIFIKAPYLPDDKQKA